jgi:hypothetical protein
LQVRLGAEDARGGRKDDEIRLGKNCFSGKRSSLLLKSLITPKKFYNIFALMMRADEKFII